MHDTGSADSHRAGSRRRGRALLHSAPALALALTILATVGSVVAAPVSLPGAFAAGSVSITNSAGGSTADPDYATSMTVSGSGFQSIQGGFGGIYVLFGWVDSGWQPSTGGEVGRDYRYVPDSEAKDNAGFQRFVAFPGSDTAEAANAVMDASGGWSTDFTVPGASFNSVDRTGAISVVDCLTVQCGILTIGAHGVKNANNETFTPISFAAPVAGGAGAGGSAAGGAAAAGTAAGAGAAVAGPAAVAAGTGASAARVGYTSGTAVAGNALSFTGQGFTPGEQVVATFDNGAAAVGPLTAGAAGEVAAVLTIPADVRAGTHVLSLSGAASGALAESEVTVAAAPDARAFPATSAITAEAPPAWPYLLLAVAILAALVLLVVSLVTALVRAGRHRRVRRAAREAVAVGGTSDAGMSSSPSAGGHTADRVGR
ncbi:hypothetical protein [Subtercola boreus]|uniref:hypothetical protein n=1 Tax=Subtercola boreus TaxID=120213 RepID=UPI0015584B4D|nr:hypothetical protein [Subtercola boreus]